MRILGIDYGTKRVGVAVSDESRKFAIPLTVITNTNLLVEEIKKIARDQETNEIVIGESRKYDMSPNAILPDILALKEKLDELGYKTILELEFMTSQQAEREQGKHAKIDSSAAALILQSYLDKENA